MTYQIIKELDNDENSVVELVEDTGGKRFVRRIMHGKVKVYLALHKLSHRFLPKIETAEFDGENTVIIEEYIENIGDLSCLDGEREIINAFCELCEVLNFIHSQGIIHRDIKPSNVLVANDGHIRLIDFDAARQHKTDASEDTRYLGTKGYAAPEQFGFTQTDFTADIYALGVTMKTVMGKLSESRKYRGIIRKCTEFDPVNRYQNAAAIKTSLVLGKKRYYLEAAASVLACAVIVFSASLLISRQSDNTDNLPIAATVTEAASETTVPQTEATTAVPETTTLPQTTTTAVTISETEPTTLSEEATSETTTTSATTSATTTSATTTTVPVTEAEFVIDNSALVSEALEASDEDFELISPRNERLIPKVTSVEVADGLYADYLVDEYRFVADRAILGRWETVAIIDTFDPQLIKKYFLSGDEEHVKSPEIGHIQSLEFADYGQCFSYYNTYASISKWTHGVVVNDYFINAQSISNYYIYRIDGVDYLFVEGKLNDGDLKDDRTATGCVAFKKFIKDENKAETTTAKTTTAKAADIKREIISPTDETKLAKFEKRLADNGKYYDIYIDEYKFINDTNVIGEWIAVDYINDYENWIYDSNKDTDELWLKKVEFKSDGSYMCYTKDNTIYWKWTYGQTITEDGGWGYCVGSYYLYNIDGEDFLFVEWKNGDYITKKDFDTSWYAFKRV